MTSTHRLASPKVRRTQAAGAARHTSTIRSWVSRIGHCAAVEPSRAVSGIIQDRDCRATQRVSTHRFSSTLEQVEVAYEHFETLTADVKGRIVPWLAAEFVRRKVVRRYRFVCAMMFDSTTVAD